jgi:hypothetical protein
MSEVTSLQQQAANTNVAAIKPLMTLRLPSRVSGDSRDVFRFQIDEQTTVVFQGQEYEYLHARVDNVAGSQIPYSPYLYQIVIDNSNRGGTVHIQKQRVRTTFDSLRKFIADNDGLRNASLHIYYDYPDRERFNRESVFRVGSSTIGIYSVIIYFMAPFATIVPAYLS